MTGLRAVVIMVLAGAAFLVAACLVAACGSSVPGAASATEAVLPPRTTTAAHTTTATPTTAVDGTDLGTCADGNCEVQVTGSVSIPVSSSLGVGPVSVTAIAADSVSVTISASASQVSDDCTGDLSCVAEMHSSFGAGGGDSTVASATGHVGARFVVNQLAVEVVAVGGGSAILRLTTG